MDGRLEGEIKIHNETLKILFDLPDYVTGWYNQMRASKKTASSRKDFVYKIKKYLQTVNKNTKTIKIEQLTNETIVNYMTSIETRKDKNGKEIITSGSYQKTIWAALNNFFTYLEDEELIKKNPMKRIGKCKKDDLPRINKTRILLTQEDFNSILADTKENNYCYERTQLKNRDMAILLIFMCTGIRVTALTQINIEDVDLDNKTVIITDKENEDRICDLTDTAIKYIKLWIKDREKYNKNSLSALFLSEQGKRIHSISVRQMVKSRTEKALGYAISPHKLRSGFCSILYHNTLDEELVRKTVGHKNITTTQRYIVSGEEDRQKVRDVVGTIGLAI